MGAVVLELLSSILSFFVATGNAEPVKTTDWNSWLNRIEIVLMPEWTTPKEALDEAAAGAVQQHLAAMVNAGMSRKLQGVWIQTDKEILAKHQGLTPLSAASLTKVATTLAALSTWEHNHQFEMLVSATGSIKEGVLQGDLVLQASSDPFFVWEEAIALANALEQAGITRVTGDLIVSDNFVMNFQTDPTRSANLFKQGVHADRWNAEAAAQYLTLPTGTAKPRLTIAGEVQVRSLSELNALDKTPVLRHRSLPLVEILKGMNTFSNNVMSELMANAAGGAKVVAQKAANAARIPVEEIQIINGSGLGNENRISPRAVVAMFNAIQYHTQPNGLNVADLFPVIGRERGTLGGRSLPTGAAVKTGTLDDVSALAGAIPTRDRGIVWFSIINVGGADLDELHRQQDMLIQDLLKIWGIPTNLPAMMTPSDRTSNPNHRLGAPDRNEILLSSA